MKNKKIISCIVCFCCLLVFGGCQLKTTKPDLPTNNVSDTNSQIGALSDIIEQKPEWTPDKIIPAGCEEPTIINQDTNSYVILVSNNEISLNSAKQFYQSLTQNKDNVNIQETDSYYAVSWTEDDIDISVQATKVEENKVTIAIDFYNGSMN